MSLLTKMPSTPPHKPPISVFQLPDSVRNSDPEAYLPRRVAVGPYHHFRPELIKMELFKIGKAKNQKWGPQLNPLLDMLKSLDLKIRASFDQSLKMDVETLSWVLLIDGLFLLELLQNRYNSRPLKLPLEFFYGKLPSEFEIVSDILKLENQIPLFVLKQICPKQPTNYLADLLYQISASVSPFELPKFESGMGFHEEIYNMSHHLLHFLYFLVLLTPKKRMRPPTNSSGNAGRNASYSYFFPSSSPLSDDFLSECFNILGSVINITFLQQLKETFNLILRLFALLSSIRKPNLAEKRTPRVPSASELKTAGVRFQSTKNGVLRCCFDQKTLTLTLPCVNLDAFCGVVLRNLVAYEAMAELNPPCLVNYIAIMSGLLRNSKDLKILEKAEIVCNYLESEKEAVEMFNGVENSSRSLRKEGMLKIHLESGQNCESKSEYIREFERNYYAGLGAMVEEINKWYGKCWRMKMKKFVSIVLSCLAILVVVFLIVVVIARFICGFSFVSCPKGIFKTSIASASDVLSLRR